MKCPIDQTELQMTERQSIEIDYCPTCRGVWLDRGELDKIIERSEQVSSNGKTSQIPYESKGDEHYKHGKYRKRESLLGDLFDF